LRSQGAIAKKKKMGFDLFFFLAIGLYEEYVD
jgi:hypothetical protein